MEGEFSSMGGRGQIENKEESERSLGLAARGDRYLEGNKREKLNAVIQFRLSRCLAKATWTLAQLGNEILVCRLKNLSQNCPIICIKLYRICLCPT